jgi:hypothetical protein
MPYAKSGAVLGAPAFGEPTHLEEWVRLKAAVWLPLSVSGTDDALGMSAREAERPRPGPNILVLRNNRDISLWKKFTFIGSMTYNAKRRELYRKALIALNPRYSIK